MRLDSTAITVLLWIIVLLHLAACVIVLFDRLSWGRKLSFTRVMVAFSLQSAYGMCAEKGASVSENDPLARCIQLSLRCNFRPCGVPLIFPTEEGWLPGNWLAPPISAKFTPVVAEEQNRVAQLCLEEFSKYERKLLNDLSGCVVVKRLLFRKLEVGGTYLSDFPIVNMAVPSDDLRRIPHHEISSVLFNKHRQALRPSLSA
jgi:hypothetical protein